MLKAVLLTLLAGGVVHCDDNNFVCEGIYKIDSLQKCDNPEQYKFDISATKRKINRTHDGLTMKCDLPEAFTVNLGMAADVYSKCDGGYKLADSYSAPSFCGVLNQYVKVEFEKALAVGGYIPPNCPIPKGVFEVLDYVLDTRNFPKQAKCGEWKFEVYALQGFTKVACVTAYVTISPLEADDVD